MEWKTNVFLWICCLVLWVSCNPLEEKNFFTPRPVAVSAVDVSPVGFVARWNKVLIADEYTLEVSKDKSFAVVLHSYLTKDTFVVVADLDVNTPYYYRLRFRAGTVKSQLSNTISVSTMGFEAPMAFTPQVSDQMSFEAKWARVKGASKYIISVSEDAGFVQMVSNFENRIIADTSILVQNLKANKEYYYKVRAMSLSDTSPYSNVINVKTLSLVVPLALEAQNSGYSSFVAIWRSSPLAQSYLLDVSTDARFESFVKGYNQKETLDTLMLISGLQSDLKYYYRVRSKGVSSVSEASRTITVSTSSLPSPRLVSDIAKSDFSISINWAPVDDGDPVDNYVVEVDRDPEFKSMVRSQNEQGTTATIGGLQPNTLYYYHVLSERNSVKSTGAEVRSIKTQEVPQAFNLSARDASQFEFTLVWELANNIVNYEVDLSRDPNFTPGSGAVTYNVTGNSFVFTKLEPGTKYYCRLRSISQGFLSANTEVLQASTLYVPIPTDLRTLSLSALDASIGWGAATGIVDYEVDLSRDPGFLSGNVFVGNRVVGNVLDLKNLEPNTGYYTRIRSISGSFKSENSSVLSFRTTPVPVPANLVAKDVSQFELTLNWDLVPGIVEYEVDVSTDPNFLTGNVFIGSTVYGNSMVVRNLSPNTKYYCRLRSLSSIYPSASTPSLLVQTLPIPAPVVADVLYTERNVFDITYRWSKVAVASTYIYEIAEDPAFQTIVPIPSGSELATNASTFRSMDFRKQYYFRVRAKYANYYSDYSNVVSVQPMIRTGCFFKGLAGTDYTYTFEFDSQNKVSGIIDVSPNSSYAANYYAINYENERIASIEKWDYPKKANYIEKWSLHRNADGKVDQIRIRNSSDVFVQLVVYTYDPQTNLPIQRQSFSDEAASVLLTTDLYYYNSDKELISVKDEKGFEFLKYRYNDYLNPYATLDPDLAFAIRHNGGEFIPVIPVRTWEFEKMPAFRSLKAYQQSYTYRSFGESNLLDLKIPDYRYANKQLTYTYTPACSFGDFTKQ